jgi:hypothetical protein
VKHSNRSASVSKRRSHKPPDLRTLWRNGGTRHRATPQRLRDTRASGERSHTRLRWNARHRRLAETRHTRATISLVTHTGRHAIFATHATPGTRWTELATDGDRETLDWTEPTPRHALHTRSRARAGSNDGDFSDS